jgi:hypothetical protein
MEARFTLSMKSIYSLLCATLFSVAFLRAAVVIQTDAISQAETSFASPGSRLVMPANFLTTTFQPFDSSMGSLESFTLTWTLHVEWDYEVGVGGNSSVAGGVTSYLGGIPVTGSGGDNGYSIPGSGTLSINPDTSSMFTVSEITDGPAASLYDLVTGADPFTALYESAINADLTGDASVAVRVTSSVTLTYVYATVAEPASYGLFTGLGVVVYLTGTRRTLRPRAV